MNPTRWLLVALWLPTAAFAAPPPWAHAPHAATEDGESMGEFVGRMRAEGLRGRDLAEAIHAEKARRGHGQGRGKGPVQGEGKGHVRGEGKGHGRHHGA